MWWCCISSPRINSSLFFSVWVVPCKIKGGIERWIKGKDIHNHVSTQESWTQELNQREVHTQVHSSIKCETAWEFFLWAEIACKTHGGRVGYQNLRVESTCTMALILYDSAICLKRFTPIFHFFAIFHLFSFSPNKSECFQPVFCHQKWLSHHRGWVWVIHVLHAAMIYIQLWLACTV